MHLAGGRGDQHVVGHIEVASPGERLAESRLREGDDAADRLRVSRGPHREGAVEGEGVGPAQRLQPELCRTPLDLEAKDLLVIAAAKRLEGLRGGQLPREHRLPLGGDGHRLQHTLRRQIGERRGEVEIERGVGGGHTPGSGRSYVN